MSDSNLGVWTSQDYALVLIDYQKQMFEQHPLGNKRRLGRAPCASLSQDCQGVGHADCASTVGVEAGFNGPTRPSILAELANIPVIDRSLMNAFEDRAFREAVTKTGRKRLVVGALHAETLLILGAAGSVGMLATPTADAADAHRLLENGRAREKLVLKAP